MSSAQLLDRAPSGHAGSGSRALAAALAATVVLAVATEALLRGSTPVLAVLAVATGVALTTAIAVLPAVRPGQPPVLATVGVVVPAVVLLPWHGVVLAVGAGTALGWVGRRLPGLPTAAPAARSAEVGLAIGHAVLGAGVAGLASLAPTTSPAVRVALAVAGGAAYLAVEQGLVTRLPGPRDVGVHATAMAGGLLAALAATLPGSAAWVLLHAVLVTVVAGACWSLAEGRATASALLRVAAHAHASIDLRAVERSIEATFGPLLHADRLELRDLPPATGEDGTLLPLDGDPMWLVTAHHGRVPATSLAHDRRLLAAAAPLVATAVENARRHDVMTTRASVDALTGVGNRATFEEELRRRLRHGRITDGATALAVLDLDGFKAVNDELGHGVGDALLVEVARRLSGAVRRGDLVARLGGDEFVVLASLASEHDEDRLRSRIVDRLADLRAPDGRHVGVSVGLALAPRDAGTPPALYEAADARMYADKSTRP